MRAVHMSMTVAYLIISFMIGGASLEARTFGELVQAASDASK